MIYPSPPMAFFMGGESYHDAIVIATLVFGAGAIDDGNWPGSTAVADRDNDSCETVPPTHMFVAESDKPTGRGDYPLRQCAASGHFGAPHAMVRIDGRWYLRDYAPNQRQRRER